MNVIYPHPLFLDLVLVLAFHCAGQKVTEQQKFAQEQKTNTESAKESARQ